MSHTTTPIAPATRRPEAQALRAGAALKRQRLELGLSQAVFAKRLAMTRVDYEALERGDLMSSIPAARWVA